MYFLKKNGTATQRKISYGICWGLQDWALEKWKVLQHSRWARQIWEWACAVWPGPSLNLLGSSLLRLSSI